ncbi:hypothetical protein ABEX78_23890 [Priestia megaterium]
MQGYIGLVRYSCGTVHSFNLDKGLKNLCGNKFGLGEKITWGDPSEVTCTSCQEILYEMYETDFNLNDQEYSPEHIDKDDTNYNIPYIEDSIPEADDSFEPQLTAAEDEEEMVFSMKAEPVGTAVTNVTNSSGSSDSEESTIEEDDSHSTESIMNEETYEEDVPSMVLESIDTTANTEDCINLFSDFEEDNLESKAEHQPINEPNNNISIAENGKGGTPEVEDSYTFQSTTVEEMHKEILAEVASSVETDSVNTTVTDETGNNDSSNFDKNNLEVDSEDNSNNTDDNIGNLDHLDDLDDVEDLNINEEAEEPVIILI